MVIYEPADLHAGPTLVVGDAAGLADPFTGEGIYAALYSACLAAEVIAEQVNWQVPDLGGYTSLVRERMGPELANAFRVTRWFFPASGLVHRLLHRHQGLATCMLQVIAGDLPYTSFFDACRNQPALLFCPGGHDRTAIFEIVRAPRG
ncbi:NAD(P)/FAD-dependent oxidoreductase [Moorella sp. E306M]|uniref:NAD(P)/FAD-dependent oxidoreductase n=1 Tax=Moorella sp. E306M TaxID=2572683 RepID=UPI001143243A|nr:hypothetical protein [Moorella sp. E306M]